MIMIIKHAMCNDSRYMGIQAMGARREMAQFLCETYISETAPKQVNIDHNMRESNHQPDRIARRPRLGRRNGGRAHGV